MRQKIVFVGGPGTGKSSVIKELLQRGYTCMQEVSRQVTLQAKKDGIDQLFLKDPLLFSQLLLDGRKQQFIAVKKNDNSPVFFDRGIPDIEAYLQYVKTKYSAMFSDVSKKYRYNKAFYFSPWKEIYTPDNERYETYSQLLEIDFFLKKVYQEYDYSLITVPNFSVKKRTDFILKNLI